MAQSQKFQWWSRERLDLPDLVRLQDFIEDDFQLQNTHLLAGGATSWISKGFLCTNPGGLAVTVTVANSALFNSGDATTTLSGTLYIADGSLPVSESVALTASSANYIHVRITRATSSNAQRVFLDPSLADGLGAEYKEYVDTAEIKEYEFIVTTAAWSADDRDIPIAKVTCGVAAVTEMLDNRNLFFRLGKGVGFDFGVIGSVTPTVTLPANDNLNVAGVYSGAVNATYVVEIDGTGATDTYKWSDDGGGTWSAGGHDCSATPTLLQSGVYIYFTAITGHTMADSWSFPVVANSGAAYEFRLVAPYEPDPDRLVDDFAFTGGDKEIDNQKEWMDLIMSNIKEMKFGHSTTYSWFTPAPSNLSGTGIIMTGGGEINWNSTTSTMTFTEDFTFVIPGSPYTNYISGAALAPPFTIGSIAAGNLIYVDIDKTSSASLTYGKVAEADYVPAPDRMIILHRIVDTIYLGVGALRLDNGETGQLITPLTTQTLAFIGAANEAEAAPDYATLGGNPVHYIGNTDNLALAMAKIGYAFTSRYGDTYYGDLILGGSANIIVPSGADIEINTAGDINVNTGGGIEILTGGAINVQTGGTAKVYSGGIFQVDSGATATFANQPAFNFGGAPFTVANSTVVTGLNADLVDAKNAHDCAGTIANNGNNLRLLDCDGNIHSDITVAYASSSGSSPLSTHTHIDAANGGSALSPLSISGQVGGYTTLNHQLQYRSVPFGTFTASDGSATQLTSLIKTAIFSGTFGFDNNKVDINVGNIIPMSIQCWYINAGAGAPFWYEVDNQPSGTGTKYYNPSTNVLTIVSGAVGDTGHDTYYCIVHYLV